MTVKQRFNEPKSWLFGLSNEILVECPECGCCATVIKNEFNTMSERRLLCKHCGHTRNGRKTTYTVSVKRYCPQCGQFFHRSINHVSMPKVTLKVSCPHCDHSAAYGANNLIESHVVPRDVPTDDYYFLPLWLTLPFKGHVVWAFNHTHLSLLHRYIAADLREKRLHDGNAKSIEQKLPKWMKLRKNREPLLKILAKLDKKLENA